MRALIGRALLWFIAPVVSGDEKTQAALADMRAEIAALSLEIAGLCRRGGAPAQAPAADERFAPLVDEISALVRRLG